VAVQSIEHWFDRATKFLASGAVPRRSLLQSAVFAGASTLASKAAFAASNDEVAQRIPPILPVPRTVAPCTLQYTAAGTTTTTFSAQSTYQGKALVLHGVQTTTGHHDRSLSFHSEVTYGGALLFELVHSALQARGPNHRRVLASKGAVTYGAAVRGIKRVQYLASGGTVTGFMDGRGFVANVRTPAALRFADRRPAPLDDTNGAERLLVSWNPSCGFCGQLLEPLKAWEARTPASSLKMLVIARGDAAGMAAAGFRSPVGMDHDGSVSRAYGMSGTPMAVLVDARGVVASEVAAGAGAILQMIERRTGAATS